VICGLLAASCQRAIPDEQSRSAVEDDVREAVFRYQFKHNASGAQQNVDYYFLDLGPEGPIPEFMARFEAHSPEVLPVSEATASPAKGVSHKDDGGHGLIFKVGEIQWIDKNTVDVEGGYYEAGLSASGNIYRVERKSGKWIVTKDTMHWIS
jgi:hypothetical protein